MFGAALKLAAELGLSSLVGAGFLFNTIGEATRKKKKQVALPLENGKFFAGMVLSARDLRMPRYRAYREFLRKNADGLELSPQQRKAVGANSRRRDS